MRLILFCALFLSLPFFMKREFKLPPPLKEITYNPAWEMAPTPEVIKILQQPFDYLAHGNQSTVFMSRDGQYVLKLFRYNRTRFPLIHKLKNWFANKPKHDLFSKAHKTFTAAYLACTEAREQTQAIYCHLNLTKDQLPKTFLGHNHLSLDRYRFVLQKKVSPFKETLLSARSNPQEMEQLIDSFVHLLIERSALGIRNSDPNLGPNFGFLDGQAVEIDFGNYRKAPQTAAELANYFTRFEHWLKKNAPEYIDYLKLQVVNNK